MCLGMVVWMGLAGWRKRYVTILNEERANALLRRLIAIRGDEALSLDRRQQLTKKLMGDVERHVQGMEFVVELSDRVAGNVTDIRGNLRKAG